MNDLATTFRALGDQTRLAIIRRLLDGAERTCREFYDLGISKSTMSHHFRVLREAGLITVRAKGRERWVSLASDVPGLILLQVQAA